jgi:peptidoglycan/xylan/chitin deacetylase (PgdA/CDA1 family)
MPLFTLRTTPAILLIAFECGLLSAGCGRMHSSPLQGATTLQASAPAQSRPAEPTDAELARAGVNEAGLVPILEYHNIKPGKAITFRTPGQFRSDLQRLYTEGYRPVSLREYLQNRIDVPLGKHPVVLTFDDALRTQFRYRPDGNIDPDCAIGILQRFHADHPDFPIKATFFVLPREAFGSKRQAARKMRELIAMGCEVQNHTVTHRYFNRLSDAQICQEIALCRAAIEQAIPGTQVDMLALPGGILPRSHNRRILAAGEYEGIRYTNQAVLLAADCPAKSPIVHRFDPMALPRIVACEASHGITYWLNKLRAHPQNLYTSDGARDVVSIPETLTGQVDTGQLQGARLRIYKATTSISGTPRPAPTHRTKHSAIISTSLVPHLLLNGGIE